jgi:hypothetical protein
VQSQPQDKLWPIELLALGLRDEMTNWEHDGIFAVPMLKDGWMEDGWIGLMCIRVVQLEVLFSALVI